MGTLKVECEVQVYEVDGEEISMASHKKLTVTSHWNRNEMVKLEFGEGTVTVLAADLIKAINNAINTK